jgi:YcaO-like protein with predicted kinase domain
LELLARYPAEDIGAHLGDDRHVAFRENGNRIADPGAMIARLEPLLERVGITRVADVSALSTHPFPVFQAVRPNLHFHTRVGQNTGSQGKGPSAPQARVSAAMEALEGYCAEPRGPIALVRGSFELLHRQHVVLDPRALQRRAWAAPPALDEPLMWTDAFCPSLGEPALVPAEAVFFPFLPEDYATRTIFPCGSNGLASGATYLEAVTHALYELIERHYLCEWQEGRAAIERCHLQGLVDIADHAENAPDFELALHALSLPSAPNFPVMVCALTDVAANKRFTGAGCAGAIETAVSRAVSEAWQAATTVASGAREDLAQPAHASAPSFPEERTLRAEELRARVVDRSFTSLREEYHSLLSWLRSHRMERVLIANLTRVGVDVPVVKAVVPGLTWNAALRDPPRPPARRGVTTLDVFRARHAARRPPSGASE